MIVKPALSYLDVISKVKDRFSINNWILRFNGVYSMIKSASKENLIEEIDVQWRYYFPLKELVQLQ